MKTININLSEYLNDKQIEAASIIDGPVIVFAGAGTGKTRTLTYRVANMVAKGISANNILAITFTNKAANEMRERVKLRIGEISSKIFIGTFHSFGLKVLRENYEALGYLKNVNILDRDDVNSIIKRQIKDLGFENEK